MSKRGGYQAGVPVWVALVVPDPERSAAFYRELFGWETADLMPAGSEEHYLICTLDGREVAAIVSAGPAPPPEPMWATHVQVDDVVKSLALVRDAGGTVIAEPWSSPAGGRIAVIADPAGAALCLWELGERAGAQLVNEPGAWAMSQLLTSRPEESERFYEQVFRWRPETFELEMADVTLYRLPGYIGGEAGQPVSREVVATMVPVEAGATPAIWGVDFWVADADAAAARVDELGGSVLSPPRDVPGFRSMLIEDPDGAMLSVSSMVRAPE